MASPRPKPTHLKVVSGNPGKRKINKAEPKPKREIPSCPAHLDDVSKVAWGRMCDPLYLDTFSQLARNVDLRA